jgi:hypothetical protein
MRRMFQVLSVVGVLLTAVSAHAQTATVQIDFPGAAAVEAGMSDPKPVDPDPQGRRRASIAVPTGDRGTIYAMTRANGTTVVRLVSDGQPAPTGFTKAGRYSAGQQITFDTKTLTISQASGPNSMDDARGTNRWRGGARFGFGYGSYGDAIDDNCDELTSDLDLTCEGDNGGPTWFVGGDFGRMITEDVDFRFRGSLMRLPKISLTADGTFEGINISATGSGSGNLWILGGEVGYHATPRIRIYGGGAISPFTFDSELSVDVFGQTETEEQDFSGIGRTLLGGLEWKLRNRVSLFGEVSRTWLKDDSVGSDAEPFDERLTALRMGIRLGFSY